MLVEFRCRHFRAPWTEAVEYVICERLSAELAGGHARALGAFVGAQLVGVVAWTETKNPPIWHSAILAVAHGYQNGGYGTLLKDEQLRQAWAEGATAVRAIVHRDNAFMLNIYRRLGGSIARDPSDPLREHLICEIRLR